MKDLGREAGEIALKAQEPESGFKEGSGAGKMV